MDREGIVLNQRFLAIASGLGIIILSQLMGVLAKLALFDVPAFTFVWLQLAIAAVFLSLRTFVFRRDLIPKTLGRRDWAAIIFVGLVNFGMCRLLMMMAIERLPMNTFVFVLSFVSLVTLGLSVLFLGERPSRVQLVGVVIAILGLRLFFQEWPETTELRGILYAVVVVFGLASCNNVTRWLMSREGDKIESTFLSTMGILVGGIPIVLAGLSLDWPPQVGGVRNGLIILANGLIGIAWVQTVFNGILRTLRSYEASVIAGSGLIWTALLGIPILGEWLTPLEALGVVIVLAGVFLAQWRPEQVRL